VLSVPLADIPISVEASPATIDEEKLNVLRRFGIDRVSLGIQSFQPEDLRALGRPQRMPDVWRAVEFVRRAEVRLLNLDLIYGHDSQSPASWLGTLREAACCQPDELYIYPLYTRPLTALGRKPPPSDDVRQARYRQAREFLLASGFEQVSMRMFRQCGQSEPPTPVYCCQADGMIGLGVGARSYTRELHYSSPFAVRQKSILATIENYGGQSPSEMAQVRHGFELDGQEQRRRYVILTLLQVSGVDAADYLRRFGSELLADVPQLEHLTELGLAEATGNRLALTAAGLEQSDALGPWLYSQDVRRRMQEFSWTAA
jgi:oxygen-independent coproporphyrinogen-3 oxidase